MLDIPIDWERTKESIFNKKGLVVVLGVPNVGKSSFIYYLSKEALKCNIKVAIINSDLGQSELGIPTTVSLSIPEREFYNFDELPINDWYFVGAISPVGHLLPLIVGVKKLVERAKLFNCELILVNTCGLILGKLGNVLKYYKLSLLEPDHIVLIRKDRELESFIKILHRLTKNFYVISQSRMARERSWEERKSFRQKKFRNYFAHAEFLELPTFLLHSIGKFIDRTKKQIYENRLVALLDEKENLLGLGIIKDINFEQNSIIVFTPFKVREKIRRIELGDLYLSLEGEELRRSAPHL
ncbi:MAG: AAA family ATPase [Dictyoglomus sp. NZ13-RE01]|nr:MAG: AAA family ATPase [Dictyoglomus sp. NZ13-RE01]